MPSSRDEIPIRVLQEAAEQYAKPDRLRQLARELGMSPTAVADFINGKTKPREATLRKLREWYVKAVRGRYVTATGEGTALIAIQLLVQDRPTVRQKKLAQRIQAVLHEDYIEVGVPVPHPMKRLEKLIDTAWP